MTLLEIYQEKNARVNEAAKERRELVKLVQTATKVSPKTVSFWLNGRTTPDPVNRKKIAKALKVTETELFLY